MLEVIWVRGVLIVRYEDRRAEVSCPAAEAWPTASLLARQTGLPLNYAGPLTPIAAARAYAGPDRTPRQVDLRA